MGFIAVTRWSVRWSCELDHTLKIGAVVLVNLGLAVAIFLLPLFLFSKESLPFGMALAFMNSVDALAALIFVVLALVMLAHRLVWPVINRPVYALAALGGARRNLFGVVGVALLGYAGIDLPELLKKIIEATAG